MGLYLRRCLQGISFFTTIFPICGQKKSYYRGSMLSIMFDLDLPSLDR